MQKTSVSLAALAAAAILALSGCGGGGGSSGGGNGGSSSTITPLPLPVTITCPNGGSATGTTAADAAALCAPVGLTSADTFQGSVVSPGTFKGLTLQYTGALDPASLTAVFWQGAVGTGFPVTGTTSLGNGNKDVTAAPAIRLGFGQTYTLVISGKDSVGRAFQQTDLFTTSAMNCANPATWSNPAAFSSAYGDCVAPLGVQALFDTSWNTLQDNSCVIGIGTSLTPSCKAYLMNGTMLLVETTMSVSGHQGVLWAAYRGTDGTSNIVLLDATTLVPIGKTVLPGPLVSVTGNPSGANTGITIGVVTGTSVRNIEVSWNASSSGLSQACLRNC